MRNRLCVSEEAVRGPRRSLALLTVVATFLLVVGCGRERAQQAPDGSTAESTTGSAEILEGSTFTLNQRQPVPPDFRASYQRRAPIVVEFYEKGEDPYYPQGLDVDDMVNDDLTDLRDDYPQVEFFTYDIDNAGDAQMSEDLERGEYGTLAAQLEVGYTPFIAMLAPRDEGYIVQELFDGYVEEKVLAQALFDLVELTESGIEYVTVTNQGDEEVELSGFTLDGVYPETGRPEGTGEGLRVQEEAILSPGEEASIGRVPDIMDANGREVIGTFEGGELFGVEAGDQVALLDRGGAVVDTISI